MHGILSESGEKGSAFQASIDIPPKALKSQAQHSFMGMVSSCGEMLRAFELVKKIARTNSTVLIQGESGTGKELIANAIHKLSGRAGRMVPVNCGAIPEDILESELFGHEKGSFTGAISSRMGRFELANGGTIFLDEIAEMSPKLQVKLLRVLQERKVEPVGAVKSIDLDVRVVTATNKDLRQEVKACRFREDLYYRLQVVPIDLPPLRERSSDVLVLARYFMERFCQKLAKNSIHFSEEVERRFAAYLWPGNVRELENLTERLAILCDSPTVRLSDLPEYLVPGARPKEASLEFEEIPEEGIDFNALVESFEARLIQSALRKTSGNKKAAAKLLSLNRTTLVEKIKKKGLSASVEVIRVAEENRPEF